MTRVPLDGRVRDEYGRPVARYGLPWSRRWFVLARAAGPDGVTLTAAIPGYTSGTTTHDDQAAAELAARGIWRAYATALTGQDRQETEPWDSKMTGQETGT